MKFYNKYYGNNYEELITYYPRFYRDVFEMVEILKAHGRIADELEGNIEQVYLNNFIDYADEETIEKLEKFLSVGLNKSRTLEERRRFVKSYFVGFGKVSASMLAEMIQSYTGASVECYFEPFDDERNNMLYINFQRGEEPTLYMSDINLLLGKKVPAHIKWQAAVTYRFPVVVGRKRTYYRYEYDLCGTKPEIALIGSLVAASSVTAASRGIYTSDYKTPSEEAQEAGQWPSAATLGMLNRIDAGAGATVTDFGVDYIYCGTIYAQS